MSSDWKTRSVSLTQLRYEAENLEPWPYGVFEFLHNVGVVPWDVLAVQADKPRLSLDMENIPAGYLAAAAYEWDTWGPSQPSDFIFAIDAELNPQKREFIGQLLTALGRSVE